MAQRSRPNALRLPDPRGLLAIVGLLGLWAVSGPWLNHSSIPKASLPDVLSAGRQLLAGGTLVEDYAASLQRVLVGFGIGGALGLAVGGALGVSSWTERLLAPFVTTLRQVPIFGLVPLLALWFGTGESAKLVLVALGAFYPVALNTHEALRNVPARYRDVAALYRFRFPRLLLSVLIPCALPGILTGIKHGLSFAWIAVIGAELFLTAAPGLGNLLEAGREQFRMDYALIGMVLIAGTGGLMNWSVGLLEKRLLRWRQSFV